jgi:hypothetical protein
MAQPRAVYFNLRAMASGRQSAFAGKPGFAFPVQFEVGPKRAVTLIAAAS